MLSAFQSCGLGVSRSYPKQGFKNNSTPRFQGVNLHQALLSACENKNPEKIRQALAQGANPNSVTKWGETPLNLAIKNNDLESARLLIEAGADLNRKIEFQIATKPIGIAIIKNALSIGQLLLERGVCPNQPDYNGWTPLEMAASWGRLGFVKLLAKNGALLPDPKNNLLYKTAALWANPEITEFLLNQFNMEASGSASVVGQLMGGDSQFPHNLREAESLSLLWKALKNRNGELALENVKDRRLQKELPRLHQKFQDKLTQLTWENLLQNPTPLPALIFRREAGLDKTLNNPFAKHTKRFPTTRTLKPIG